MITMKVIGTRDTKNKKKVSHFISTEVPIRRSAGHGRNYQLIIFACLLCQQDASSQRVPARVSLCKETLSLLGRTGKGQERGEVPELAFLRSGQKLAPGPPLPQASQVVQWQRICLQMQETWVQSLEPIPVFMPGKSHKQRHLVGYNPWGLKESDALSTCTLALAGFPTSCLPLSPARPTHRA